VTPVDRESLRLAVYEHFAGTGAAPSTESLAQTLGARPEAVRAGLAELHESRDLVLDEHGAIAMAHPFSAIPQGFSVMGRRTLWWGGCAWDAFALPHLLPDEPDVLVATRCPGCGRPHAWVVNSHEPPPGDQVAHFLIPVARIWDDVVRTCGHQRLFCSEDCVHRWLAETGNQRGDTFDLTTLWRLASHWYEGRLERGYVRREPAQAKAYFREVGLSGPFWGLD
jgi:hypothetical protein